MTEKEKANLSAYAVQCGDDTSGRISAKSPQEAGERAEEMCRVHDGVQGEPKPRQGS